jgi:TonB family protein
MRGSIIGSAVIHLAGLILLFAVRYSTPLIIPGDVVQVSLADMSTIRPVAPPPQPRPRDPEPEAPKIEPVEESGVKIAPPKPAPKKPQEPEPQKQADPTPESPQVPYARVGSAGLSGAVSVVQADFAFTYYLILVRNKIAQVWTPPSGLVTGGQPVRSVVYFKIARDGTVKGAALESTSGHEYFDRSAVRAVVISNPLPPLPEGFIGSDLGVHFGFEYGGP